MAGEDIEYMSDTDFEFNMDFALMDQQIEKFKAENARILNEWYKDCESLHAQIEELKLRREETIMQCELLKQDLAKANEALKEIRNNVAKSKA